MHVCALFGVSVFFILLAALMRHKVYINISRERERDVRKLTFSGRKS